MYLILYILRIQKQMTAKSLFRGGWHDQHFPRKVGYALQRFLLYLTPDKFISFAAACNFLAELSSKQIVRKYQTFWARSILICVSVCVCVHRSIRKCPEIFETNSHLPKTRRSDWFPRYETWHMLSHFKTHARYN